jgi:hypothetical protein
MGARKHISAEKIKEARKNLYFAKLNGFRGHCLSHRSASPV